MVPPFNLLGIRIDRLDRPAVMRKLDDYLHANHGHHIVTINPEFVELANRNAHFKKILAHADLAVADGVGIMLASQLSRQPLPARITGLDLIDMLCQLSVKNGQSVGLVGGQPGVAPLAAQHLQRRFPGLKISCADSELRWHGFHLTDKIMVQRIRHGHPDILLVAFGAPRQEEWIAKNLHDLPSVKIAVGVGGALDYWAKKIPRAPKLVRSFGLEWLFRLMVQPWRLLRIINAIIVFPWLVLTRKEKNHDA